MRPHLYSRGISEFIAEPPGSLDANPPKCKACESDCEVARDQHGAINSGMARAKMKVLHDIWSCPHTDKGEYPNPHHWHTQLHRMYQEALDTSSPSIRAIIQKDWNELRDRFIGDP